MSNPNFSGRPSMSSEAMSLRRMCRQELPSCIWVDTFVDGRTSGGNIKT